MLDTILAVIRPLNYVDEEGHSLTSTSLTLNDDAWRRVLKQLGNHFALNLRRVVELPITHCIGDNRPAREKKS